MINFFKGFIVGIGKIIPGVSGAMLAISMGIYDKAIEYICCFKKNKKESIKYLVPIGLGVILSIIFFSKIISFALDNFYLITMLFFVGLIIGSVPMVISRVNCREWYISIISFVVFFLMSFGNGHHVYVINGSFLDFVIFFLSGIIEAVGTVVPGISSTALLMIMGTYDSVIGAIGNFRDVKILIPFGIGLLIGCVLCVKVINYLFSRCENKVYAFVFGILLSSIVLLIVQTFKYRFSVLELVMGIVFMIFGIIISSLLKVNKKKP